MADTVGAPLGSPKPRVFQSEPEHDSGRRLRSMGDFVCVQVVDPEIGCVVDEAAILGSQRDTPDDGEIRPAAINKYSRFVCRPPSRPVPIARCRSFCERQFPLFCKPYASSWRERKACRNLHQPGSRAIAAPPREETTPNYSLNHARSGSDKPSASTYPFPVRPRRSNLLPYYF